MKKIDSDELIAAPIGVIFCDECGVLWQKIGQQYNQERRSVLHLASLSPSFQIEEDNEPDDQINMMEGDRDASFYLLEELDLQRISASLVLAMDI